MAKRRFRSPEDASASASSTPLTAEERRRERKRQRSAKDAGNVRAGHRSSPWKRVLIIGVPIAVIVAIVVLLLANLVPTPCLDLTPIPASSGTPLLPPKNGSIPLSESWCPPGVTPVLQAFPLLTIRIGSTDVSFPSNIGRDTNYTYQGGPYTCQIPIATAPASQTGLAPGTISIVSPWAYVYTLGDFFQAWAQTSSTVRVNASHPSQPVTYTSTDLLGFTPDATHAIALWVDNARSSAGPTLNLDALSNSANVYPSCLARVYGTGHTILLTYTSSSVAALHPLGPTLAPTPGSTGTPPPSESSSLGGPMPPAIVELHAKALAWLLLRVAP